jgi:hypothetical protein
MRKQTNTLSPSPKGFQKSEIFGLGLQRSPRTRTRTSEKLWSELRYRQSSVDCLCPRLLFRGKINALAAASVQQKGTLSKWIFANKLHFNVLEKDTSLALTYRYSYKFGFWLMYCL